MSTILIVDDQSTSRIILEGLVATVEAGIRTVSFGDPLQALAWCAENTPDLVLTDYKMPVVDGVEFIRRFRETAGCGDVPVIVITIVDDKTVRYRALEAGATDILNKPVDHHECRARCRNLLTLRRQSQIIRNRARWLEKQVAEATRLLHGRERESVSLLGRICEQRLDPTGLRGERVGRFASLIAARTDLSSEERDLIELAAPLHDVGMAAIPDNIVLRAGGLSEAEHRLVQSHTRRGHELLSGSQSPYLQMAASIALHHHERFDGSGYPGGLAGAAIPLVARIVAVADVYDAITSDRPYAQAMSLDAALDFLNRGKGGLFDPDCVEALASQMDSVAAFDQQHRILHRVD